MKFLTTTLCFLLGCVFFLSGKDDLELIREQLTSLEAELQGIDSIELGSKRHKKVKILLDDFEDTAIRLQKNVRALPYMNDIRCADCAKSIKAAVQSAIGTHKGILDTNPVGNSVLSTNRLSPEQALDIILKDIEGMEEVKFSPVTMDVAIDKGCLSWYQFVRCYTFCKTARKDLKKNFKNPVWKAIFVERAALMKELAEKLTDYLLQRYGKEIKNIYLEEEAEEFHSELLRMATEGDIVTLGLSNRKTLRGLGNSSTSANLKTNKKNTDPVTQIDLVIRVVRKDFAEMKKKKEKEEKEREKAKAAEQKEKEKQEKQALKLDEEKQKEKEKKEREKQEKMLEREKKAEQQNRIRALNKASEEEIAAELEKVYGKYFPGNDQASLSETQKNDCMERMTDKQKKLFDSTRERLAREGVNKDELDLETLKEIRPMLNSRNYLPDRKTAVELILREDSDK